MRTLRPSRSELLVKLTTPLLLLGRKFVVGIVTVLMVTAAIFGAVQMLPQDPATTALGPYSTQEQRAAFDKRMGLDRPAGVRYITWLGGMVHGDFGKSVVSGHRIGGQIAFRLRYTALLAGVSLILGTLIALPIAMFAARHAGRGADVAISSLSLAISALPEYVLGVVLLLLLAVKLHVFPVVSGGILDGQWSALGLPAITLSLVVGAYVYRLARVSVAESLAAPYVRTAVLNGFSPRRVLWHHVMPNAGVVVVNVIAQNAMYLLGGVIVVENVFAYPGLGTLLVQAVSSKDFTLIEGCAVVLSALFVGINFLADGAVFILSPRLRART